MIANPHWFNRLQRFQFSENTLLLTLAVMVGLMTGVGIWIFRLLIGEFHTFFTLTVAENGIGRLLESVGMDTRLSMIPTLALAGLLVGLIMNRFVGHEKYHGVAGIMESAALTGGRLPYWKMPFKALSSSISLGAGASVGPEDPSVQIGANLGSFLGQRLQLSEERVSLLVSAGAASAIAAAFNAPVAGVFFALEVILGEFTSRSFGIVVLAAVISSAFTQAVRGPNPIFDGLSYTFGSPVELIFYVLLGVLLAGVSSVGIRVFHRLSEQWRDRIRLSPPLRTAFTGMIVAAVGLFFPQIMGPGEEVMHDVLIGHDESGIVLLLALAGIKLVMTAISQGGGFVGGVFAPTLFVGIMIGRAYGQILERAVPGLINDSHTFAIAGMAGMLAGIVRSPITAILLVFELTSEYLLILPIMLTTVICVYFLERKGPPGIYALSLINHGVHLQQGRDVDVMQGVTVGEAMMSPAPMIRQDASLIELRNALRQYNSRSLCVVDEEGMLHGIVTLSDLQRSYESALQQNEGGQQTDLGQLKVWDICTREVITAYESDVLWTAIRNMGARDVGRLPVLKDGTRVLVGMLRRHDIVDAYNMAIARKLQDQHNAEQIRLNNLTGAHVVDYHVRPNAEIAGKHICDIVWPPEAIVASIQRKNKLIVPHGSTEIKVGDVLTIVTDPDSERALERIFGHGVHATMH